MSATSRIGGVTFGLAVLLIASACGGPSASPSPAAVGYEVPSIAVSTTAGDVIASQDVTPEQAAVIEGTGPDGTVFKLELPAYAVIKPITISLRPLAPAAIDGGQLVTGVELGPAGTTFALPVSLTIRPAQGEPASLVPFAYRGSPENATGSLATTDSIDADSLHLVVAHFSGLFMAKPQSPDVLAKWEAVGKQPDPGASTPDQQAAWAEAAMAAAKYDMEATKAGGDAGSMASQTRIDAAQSVYDHASQVWVEAQMASWDDEASKVGQIAKNGDLDYATEFQQEVDKVAVPAVTAAKAGKLDADTVIDRILDVTGTYLANIAKALETDRAFQDSLAKGAPDGLATLNEIARLALSVERQVQLLGRPDPGAARLGDKLWGWMRQYAHTFGARCVAGSIVEPTIPLGYARSMAMLGDDAAARAMTDCAEASAPYFPPPKPTRDPCSTGDLWLGPPTDGTQVAEVPICGASPSPVPQPSAGDVQGPTIHGTITGHVITEATEAAGDSSVGDVSIEMDIAWNLVGDKTILVLRSGTYSMSGTVSGFCNGSGSESGSLTSASLDRVQDAQGHVRLDLPDQPGRGLQVHVAAFLQYPGSCGVDPAMVGPLIDGGCLLPPTPTGWEGTCEDGATKWTGTFSVK